MILRAIFVLQVASAAALQKWGEAAKSFADDLSFRFAPVDRYRVVVSSRIAGNFERLRQTQQLLAMRAGDALKGQVVQASILLEQVHASEQRLAELTASQLRWEQRQQQIDASLEAFRRRYNASIELATGLAALPPEAWSHGPGWGRGWFGKAPAPGKEPERAGEGKARERRQGRRRERQQLSPGGGVAERKTRAGRLLPRKNEQEQQQQSPPLEEAVAAFIRARNDMETALKEQLERADGLRVEWTERAHELQRRIEEDVADSLRIERLLPTASDGGGASESGSDGSSGGGASGGNGGGSSSDDVKWLPLMGPNIMSKADLRLEKQAVEDRLRELGRQQAALWAEFRERQAQLETSLRRLGDDSRLFARRYEDLLRRKSSRLAAGQLNDRALAQVLDLLAESENDGWELVGDRGGVIVHRKFMRSGAVSGGGLGMNAAWGPRSRFACVRATYDMAASPAAVVELFADNERVPEYNKWYLEGRDVESVDDQTKVVWAASPAVFPFKARDYCTVVHYRKLEDGTTVVLNRGADHPDAPETSEYVRAEVILGANIIQPHPTDPDRTVFTMLTQVDPGGIAPAWIVNKISAIGPVQFLKDVERAARNPPQARQRQQEPEGLDMLGPNEPVSSSRTAMLPPWRPRRLPPRPAAAHSRCR